MLSRQRKLQLLRECVLLKLKKLGWPLNAKLVKQLNAKLRLSVKPKMTLFVKQQRPKLLVKLKLSDYSLTLKLKLKLKLQPKQPLTLPLLPRPKGF